MLLLSSRCHQVTCGELLSLKVLLPRVKKIIIKGTIIHYGVFLEIKINFKILHHAFSKTCIK